jgi:hypothetical protein
MMSPAVLAQAKRAGDKTETSLKRGLFRPERQRWCPMDRNTPGLLVPADESLPVRPCTLGQLGYLPDDERGDGQAIDQRRRRWRTGTCWACTYTTPLQRHDAWRLAGDQGLCCWLLVVDDYALPNMPLAPNVRATRLCRLRNDQGGYEVRGDAFLCARTADGTGWHAAVEHDCGRLLMLPETA